MSVRTTGSGRSIDLTRRQFFKTAAATSGAAFQLLTGCAYEPAAENRAVEDLREVGARDAVARIQRGEMTAEAYMLQLLRQYNAHRDLNAVVTIDETRVLEQARSVDRARSRGELLGSLAGLPFVVKDQIDVAEYPNTAGNGALRKYIPRRSAPVVETMVRNGGIVFAKTNLPDMVVGGNLMAAAASNNRFFGAVRNPYDPSRIPGGSSGGTAAAIAARMVPAGLAEDTGGSVRFPAAFCGLAGLRPSTYTPLNLVPPGKPKRYPDAGIVPPPQLLETIGPMARTVADVAFLDSAITGEQVTTIPLREARIGIPRPSYWDNELFDQGLVQTIQTAFTKLRDAGAQLIEIDFESILKLDEGNRLGAAARMPRPDFGAWLRENAPEVTLGDIYEGLAPGRNPGRQASSQPSIEERMKILFEASNHYGGIFHSNNLNAIAFPTIPIPAPPISPDGERVGRRISVNGREVDAIAAMIPHIFFGPRLGVPGLVVPAGLTSGLPVGLELEGLSGGDSRLLGLGIAVENVLGPLPPPPLVLGS